MHQLWSSVRNIAIFRLALRALCVLLACAILSIGLAGPSRAQECPAGNGLCSDGLCYPLGYQCCNGGGACSAGNNCWAANSGNICCPGGTTGTRDGYCAPN